MLIRNMGNCGCLDKLQRIIEALQTAQQHHTAVVISLDALVYGKNHSLIEQVEDYDFTKNTLTVNGEEFPWWDIEKVNLLF